MQIFHKHQNYYYYSHDVQLPTFLTNVARVLTPHHPTIAYTKKKLYIYIENG